MRYKYILIGIVVGVLLSSVAVVLAGTNFDAPSGPTDSASQMYTLEQVYDRANDGTTATKMTTFYEPDSGPAATMYDLNALYTLVSERSRPAKTGQTDCYYSEDLQMGTCTCGTTDCPSGQDGDLQMGVAWPSPRFTDNGNGTVTDNLTGLMWLKDGDCLGSRKWGGAFTHVSNLNSAIDYSCDSYTAGTYSDWRLPSVRELSSLIDHSQSSPALPSGYSTYFTNVRSDFYWSSTSYAESGIDAWEVNLTSGFVNREVKEGYEYVWPVRGGQ